MTATYQIYALKYGERETKEGQFFFREASQKPGVSHGSSRQTSHRLMAATR